MINRYDAVALMVKDAERRAISAGVPAKVYLAHLMALESACVAFIVADDHRFLRDYASAGPAALAERRGVSKRAIRKRKRRLVARGTIAVP